MKTKHTFLVTFVAGLAWTAFLFAENSGPRPASNGFLGGLTCSRAGCHVGNIENSPTGSMTLTGLPVEWTPGQTYTLTVTVQRPGAAKYGFQLSSVSNANNTQAGTFSNTPGETRVNFRCGTGSQVIPCEEEGAIQYAMHNSNNGIAPISGAFRVNWTAPTTAAPGTLKFNLAGAAVDGDNTAFGDFIFSRTDLVSAVPPPNSSSPFSLTNLQSTTITTSGAGPVTVGYASIQALPSSTTPKGIAVFGFRQGGVFVSEAGVPSSPLMTSGRIYVEVSGAPGVPGTVNTGIAIANPNNQKATVNLSFAETSGAETFRNPLEIPPNGQIASFVDQSPFSIGQQFRGAMSFTSDVPVAVIALRSYQNERPGGSEFLVTTLPVVASSVPTPSEQVIVPHFADGGGWTTQIVLVNPTDTVLSGTVEFLNTGSPGVSATPIFLVIDNQNSNIFYYTIPARSAARLRTAGTGPTITGSVRITPSGSTARPSALSIFSFRSGAVVVSEAGAAGVPGNTFRLYAEATGTGKTSGAIQTGIAVSNMGTAPANVTFELFKLDGGPLGLANTTIALPPRGQDAKFLSDLFPTLPLPFRGILRISTSAADGVSVVGLRSRYNERLDFLITTTPASDEISPATNDLSVFPHLVNGGGWTTQFILFSGTGGQSSVGNLRYYAQDGSSLSLTN